jgi:hypothetical protein
VESVEGCILGDDPDRDLQQAEGAMVSSDVVPGLDSELRFDPADLLRASPGLQLVYETAPIGLAFLSTDCRYLMINQHLTEICGI